jgi:deoxyribodipyrimidine photo-lyase
MKTKTTTGLYWFRRDLRLADNPTFNLLAERVDRLICVYVDGQDQELQSRLLEPRPSIFKQSFEQQSVSALALALEQKKQHLVVVESPAQNALIDLINRYAVTHLGVDSHPGVNEARAVKNLQAACPQVHFTMANGHTLFTAEHLPFAVADLPKTFTPFRKEVEKCEIEKPVNKLVKLPPPVVVCKQQIPVNLPSSFVEGGELAGIAQLNDYLFTTHKIKYYKETRNKLDDWYSSSKLSFWLANGSLSARTVYQQVKAYESQFGANDSTYWLYFELLWREYFQWYLIKHQGRLFDFKGVKQQAPTSCFEQKKFTRWCEGMTDYPIVNACMRQLKQTGYMSNRGRQLVASCFVHELDLDWRYGAAYFEQQLIDYDVASNWGNWQYLAGVGADPRGHRRFDLNKQAEIYDPDAAFRKKWLGSDRQ